MPSSRGLLHCRRILYQLSHQGCPYLTMPLPSCFSCFRLCDPIDGSPTRLPRPWDSPGKNTGVGCHFLLQCMKVKSESEVAQSCLTLRNPMDCSLPGSSIRGIFQARVLEWVAIHIPTSDLELCCLDEWFSNFCEQWNHMEGFKNTDSWAPLAECLTQ